MFGQDVKMKLKMVQKELKSVVKMEKEKYKTNIEHKVTQNNMKRGLEWNEIYEWILKEFWFKKLPARYKFGMCK